MKRLRATLSEFIALAFIIAMVSSFSLPSLLEMGRASREATLQEFYLNLSAEMNRAGTMPLVPLPGGSAEFEPYPVYPRNVLGLVPPHHELVVRFEQRDIVIAHRGTAPQTREQCSIHFDARTQSLNPKIQLSAC